jgi:hypothetical protein
MIVSQITASFVRTDLFAASLSGHDAVTYTNTCFVFQVKRDERSADKEKRIEAYSSLFGE